jgi:carboxyl-terminal processing protease
LKRATIIIRAFAILALVVSLNAVAHSQSSEKSKTAKGGRSIAYYTKILSEIALSVRENYMEEVNLDDLFNASFDGMLANLDPYSVLLRADDYDALKESAYGRYEGIGIDIDMRDGEVTIISPLEGTPAARLGFRPGDKIIKIEGKLVANLSNSEFNELARGKAGTTVRLTIERPGVAAPMEYVVERAVVEVHPIKYSGMLDASQGYVRISKFAEKTGEEFRSALSNLKAKGCKSLVLDLRSNGGGLMDQAIAVVSQFIPKDRLVVYTKGQAQTTQRRYLSTGDPIFPDGNLVVLVDSGTASASEIVTGAIQDWDRGAIIGSTTYGKGLVQNIFDWDNSDFALKLTTSKYYIPSGRSIQKPERSYKKEAAAQAAAANTNGDAKKPYKTNGGRKVYGGGGITPDIAVSRQGLRPIEYNLTRENLFFQFAVEYTTKVKSVPRNLSVDDGMIRDFRAFIAAKGFDYKTNTEQLLDELQSTAEREGHSDSFARELTALHKAIDLEKEQDFDSSRDFIKSSLRREILYIKYGDTAVYEDIITKEDPVVRQAMELLKDRGKYSGLLKG